MEETTTRILIVDDDLDFASLLSDVFTQASYEVEVAGDPTKVENIVRSMDFSLVVTDLRMPMLNGFELSQKIKAIRPELPIIMVSGFLESKDREKMEAEGIVGLYEKPLSVFSLLKNAAKLIAEGKSKSQKQKPQSHHESESEISNLGFPFHALPCQSEASLAFAESIYRMRNRRQNLCIVTPRGTPSRAIAEDFCRWVSSETSGGRIIESADCTIDRLGEIAAEAYENGWSNLVLCIPETDLLDPTHQKQLARSSRRGTFQNQWDGHIRFVFMISRDVESLYQDGALSDELYLSMGGSEIHVPPLRECPEDIEWVARSTEDDNGRPIPWDNEAIRTLVDKEWPGNYTELRKVLLQIQQRHTGRPVATRDVIEAMSGDDTPAISKSQLREISLFESLESYRDSYVTALAEFLDNDTDRVSSITQTPKKVVASILES
tara:strand:+ start:1832 stop:3139 length:1308 start_codon:yes stop_codon:yes gene_type:complete